MCSVFRIVNAKWRPWCMVNNEEVTYSVLLHYSDVIMGAMASQITSLTIVYSTVYSVADQRKHQSSASLAFVRGIRRRSVNSPHKCPVTLKMFPRSQQVHVELGTINNEFKMLAKVLPANQCQVWKLLSNNKDFNRSGVVFAKPISSTCFFDYYLWQTIGYLLNITFIFHRSCHSLAVMLPVKYENDLRTWHIFAESKIFLAEKLTIAALVTQRLARGSTHWRHNERDGVSNHHPHDCLLKRWFRPRSKKTSKLRVFGLCEGNSPMTCEFPTQRASYAGNV